MELIKAGDRIFCDEKTIFLCDATWNKVKEIKTVKLPKWVEGEILW